MGKYLNEIKEEDIIKFIQDNLREDFSLDDNQEIKIKDLCESDENLSKKTPSSYTFSWQSGRVFYTITDFSCARTSLYVNREKDLSLSWAGFMRKRVSNPMQYAEDYNYNIDSQLERLANEYMFKRLKLTSTRDSNQTYKNSQINSQLEELTSEYTNKRQSLIDLKIPSLTYQPRNTDEKEIIE